MVAPEQVLAGRLRVRSDTPLQFCTSPNAHRCPPTRSDFRGEGASVGATEQIRAAIQSRELGKTSRDGMLTNENRRANWIIESRFGNMGVAASVFERRAFHHGALAGLASGGAPITLLPP